MPRRHRTNGRRVVGIVAVLVLLTPAVSRADESALDARRARIFSTVCARCHVRPGIGVPVVGDEDEWSRRREKGAAVLLANTITGFRDMPPLGTCGYCNEEDFRRLVAFVAGLPPAKDLPTATGDEGVSDEGARP